MNDKVAAEEEVKDCAIFSGYWVALDDLMVGLS